MAILIFMAGMVSPWALIFLIASMCGSLSVNDREVGHLGRLITFIVSAFIIVWTISTLIIGL